jgi:hypothetical protein
MQLPHESGDQSGTRLQFPMAPGLVDAELPDAPFWQWNELARILTCNIGMDVMSIAQISNR